MRKAIQERVQDFEALGSSHNRLPNDFYHHHLPNGSQNGLPKDLQIHEKSLPRPPGLSEGPPKGPRTLRDPISETIFTEFRRVLDRSRAWFSHNERLPFGLVGESF